MNCLRLAACCLAGAICASPAFGVTALTADTSMQEPPADLWSVDLLTGETTLWPTPDALGPGSWNGLSVRTTEPGVVYAAQNPRAPLFDDPQTSRLARVDTATGSVTMFPLYDEATLGFEQPFTTSIAVRPGETDVAYVSGSAVRIGQRYLWQVDLETGEVAGPAVRIPEDVSITAMTFDPTGETLWGADRDGRVFTIDPETAALEVVAETEGETIEGLEFDPYTGRLYYIEGLLRDD